MVGCWRYQPQPAWTVKTTQRATFRAVPCALGRVLLTDGPGAGKARERDAGWSCFTVTAAVRSQRNGPMWTPKGLDCR